MIVKVSKLDDRAKIPTRKHETDAGMDLYSLNDEIIPAFSFKVVRTGIRINIQGDYVGLIWPKGGSKHLIGAGVVDESYQGEIVVKVFNVTDNNYYIKSGEAVAQFLIQPCYFPVIEEVIDDALFNAETVRGSSGGIFIGTTIIDRVVASGTYDPELDKLLLERFNNYKYAKEPLVEVDPYAEERKSMYDDRDPLIGYNGEMED